MSVYRNGKYIGADTSLLHGTKENAFGPNGGRVGFAFLPWVTVEIQYPDGKKTPAGSIGSMWYAIASFDPFHWPDTPGTPPVYSSKYSVTKLGEKNRRRVIK